MQASLWDGAFSRAGGRDIQCNLHSVMRHGGGKLYVTTTDDASRTGGTQNETFTQGWGVRSDVSGVSRGSRVSEMSGVSVVYDDDGTTTTAARTGNRDV